jgi:hypothetical protein
VRTTCQKSTSEMIRRVVEAFVHVKMQRPDISVALLVKQAGQWLRKAIDAMLLSAPDLKLPPDRFAIDMMLSAMSGAMRSALEAEASPARFRKVREHLVLLCQSYIAAATAKDNERCLSRVAGREARLSQRQGRRVGKKRGSMRTTVSWLRTL